MGLRNLTLPKLDLNTRSGVSGKRHAEADFLSGMRPRTYYIGVYVALDGWAKPTANGSELVLPNP